MVTDGDLQAEGASVFVCNDPATAVAGCCAIFTDTWISMGQEDEAAKRKKDFAGYQVCTYLTT